MANRPANAGSGDVGSGGVGLGGAGSGRGLAPRGDVVPPGATAPPPPVHHDAVPRTAATAAETPPHAAAETPPHAAAETPPHAAAETPPHAAAAPPRAQPPRPAASHRATRSRAPNQSRHPDAAVGALAWVPYLIVLAGAGLGMFLAVQGAKHAGLGTGLLGGSLLVGALLRLALPDRCAGLLATRRKASDVLAFAAFGVAVLAVALTLP
jgi:Protein of unknown function (DUF3017)